MQIITLSDGKSVVLYDLNEIAEKLGVTRRSVYNYISDKKIKATKIGSEWRVSEQSLVDYLNGII